jgi:hypothetical protein
VVLELGLQGLHYTGLKPHMLRPGALFVLQVLSNGSF